MESLTPHDVTVIMLGLGVLLAAARLLGEVAIRLRQPAVIGEIIAGVILGPTVLGSMWPDGMTFLFPQSGPAAVVLKGIMTVGVVLFLLVAGMEVDLSAIFRQGRLALTVGVIGIVVPFGMGLLAVWLMPQLLAPGPLATGTIFMLFFATALAISSLPVIAKTLMDLDLYRTDLGMLVIAAAIFNDLVGWIIYAFVLGAMDVPGQHGLALGGTIGLTLVFLAFMLTAGRWLLNKVLPWLQAKTTWPAGVLGFALTVALLGAAFTEWIGIHAVFGSFIVGVALGDSPHLRERTRATIDQFVTSIFAPLFFAGIGLTINFATHFDWLLNVVVLGIAIVSKVASCGLSARWGGMAWRESWALGFGLNARGAMGIILGLLGLQYGIIGEEMFVALVVMSVVTSMISGSMMPWVLKRKAPRRFTDFLTAKGYINPLTAAGAEGAIRELVEPGAAISGLDAGVIAAAVLRRERMMPTGLGMGAAVPHARLPQLTKPVVCVGVSRAGIDFHAPDGERARLIFLILTPTEDDGAQLEILADISRSFVHGPLHDNVQRLGTYNEFMALLKTSEPQKDNGGATTPEG